MAKLIAKLSLLFLLTYSFILILELAYESY